MKFYLCTNIKLDSNEILISDSAIVWGVIGGVLAAIVLFSAGAGLVFWRVCKRKPAHGRVLNPGQPNAGK